MSPSPEHVKSLAGRIFTTVLAFSLGILLAFSAVMVSIFYYSYEHDAEQALVQEASRAAASLDEAPAADVTTVLSQQFSAITRYTLISESGLCSTIARRMPARWTTTPLVPRSARPRARARR